MFRFNPSDSFVVGRDEEMLLDVLRIDLIPLSPLLALTGLGLRRTLMDEC